MKILSLAFSLAGIFFLLFFAQVQKPLTITSLENLSSLQENQKVLVQGLVSEETPHFKTKLLILDNKISIICSCPLSQSYKNKNLSIIGFLDTYSGKSQINALKISVFPKEEIKS
jgi:hypothetical protein